METRTYIVLALADGPPVEPPYPDNTPAGEPEPDVEIIIGDVESRLWREIDRIEVGDPETAIRDAIERHDLDGGTFAAVPTRNWTERGGEIERQPRIKLTVPEPQSVKA